MDTKQYLGQIRKLDKMIQNKISEIYQIKSMACSISIVSDHEKVQTTPNKDKIGTIVAKIIDMENEVECLIDRRCLIVKQIDSIIDADMYDVLAKKYILGKELKIIAIENGLSNKHIVRIHKDAIEEFENKYGSIYL